MLRYSFSLPITSSVYNADLPTLRLPRFDRFLHSRLMLSLCVPTVLFIKSTGISTSCPSALINISADEKQRDIAIVLCGYKEQMEKLLDTNPGLYSRFPNRFEFADFTVDKLLEITRRRVKEYEYEFTPEAWDKYRLLLAKAYNQRNSNTWGNARFIANQLERIYIQHAMRCVKNRPTDKRQLRLLLPEDILPIEVQKEKRRIGF